ncbi:COMMD6 isoform 4 [Pongo abelii]|uniref:COMM domain-containing protein 6 n=1 Tax=Pongo abelii TaxID=9601 RepID=A0A2J8WU07_PONAB|nr:COMMD6 isoform 4 [Pongo abelii]
MKAPLPHPALAQRMQIKDCWALIKRHLFEARNTLVDFQWKLGMAVSSDTCRSLKYPYVAVMLKVADHSGQVKTKCFEMTIPQFQNFYRQFKEIAAVIETV